MITTLVLIRHAESEMNAKFPHLVGGRSNHSPVTEKGLSQSRQLGRRFAIEQPNFTAFYASPAIRTQTTAREAHAAWGVTPEVVTEDRLQEVFQGDWEGKIRAEHYTPEVIAEVIAMQGHHKAPNGESQFDVEARMTAFAQDCLTRHEGGTVVAYTHGVAIKCLLRNVQNWDPRKTYYTEIDNTSLSVITFHHDQNQWRLQRVNDAAHVTLLK